jgi:Zn-dependent protease with chaperone function
MSAIHFSPCASRNRPLLTTRRFLAATLLILLIGGAEPAPPRLAEIPADVRTRIDRLAAAQPLETLPQEEVNSAGDVVAWLIGQAALTPDQELRFARDLHKEILDHERTVPTPDAAQRVFNKLLESVPPHLRPKAFPYTLTVLDRSDFDSFPIGGGYVYITRPLLDALLSDRRHGEAALAFVLAHELGHIGHEHCRRGWLSVALQEEVNRGIAMRVPLPVLRAVLETGVGHGVEGAGERLFFLYTRRQQYEADRFALHLCRNAGFDLDAGLDSVRYLVALQYPRILSDPNFRPDDRPPTARAYYRSTHPGPLLRLARLQLERDGIVEDEQDYGLFAYDPRADRVEKCAAGSVGAGDRPIVFVHGLHGSEGTFRAYLRAFAGRDEFRGRRLLIFRYPNNESLSRCGEFLGREMARVVRAPGEAFFVCHSAGGLVFRWYAEVKKGLFDRAVLLGTPNGGSNMTALKFLVDATAFAGELRWGARSALVRTILEGHGAIIHDVHPDSLFLRRLGHDAALAARYHVISGDRLGLGQAIALQAGGAACKRFLLEKVVPRISSPLLREQATYRIGEWRMPREVTHGDFVVSVRSALLEGAGRVTRTPLNHLALTTDEDVIRIVMESVLKK